VIGSQHRDPVANRAYGGKQRRSACEKSSPIKQYIQFLQWFQRDA